MVEHSYSLYIWNQIKFHGSHTDHAVNCKLHIFFLDTILLVWERKEDEIYPRKNICYHFASIHNISVALYHSGLPGEN